MSNSPTDLRCYPIPSHWDGSSDSFHANKRSPSCSCFALTQPFWFLDTKYAAWLFAPGQDTVSNSYWQESLDIEPTFYVHRSSGMYERGSRGTLPVSTAGRSANTTGMFEVRTFLPTPLVQTPCRFPQLKFVVLVENCTVCIFQSYFFCAITAPTEIEERPSPPGTACQYAERAALGE